jgi:hypothetical protein
MKKSKGKLTVEQMVRKCFCDTTCATMYQSTRCTGCHLFQNEKETARCARRFVRMEDEQKEKLERQKQDREYLKTHKPPCRLCKIGFPLDSSGKYHMPSQSLGMIPISPCVNVKLPKHFGEMRFKSACRKTTRKGI